MMPPAVDARAGIDTRDAEGAEAVHEESEGLVTLIGHGGSRKHHVRCERHDEENQKQFFHSGAF